MPPTKPPFFNGEELATYEEKKKVLNKMKWMYFKSTVGISLVINAVFIIIIVILSVLFPGDEETPKVLSAIGVFIEWMLIFSLFYLLVTIVRFIKFIADLPVIKKGQ